MKDKMEPLELSIVYQKKAELIQPLNFGADLKKKKRRIELETIELAKNYSTRYPRVVPHHSTDRAITSLTSQIGRDAVCSGVYGRSCKLRSSLALSTTDS